MVDKRYRKGHDWSGVSNVAVLLLVSAGLALVSYGVGTEHGRWTGLATFLGLMFVYQIIRQLRERNKE